MEAMEEAAPAAEMMDEAPMATTADVADAPAPVVAPEQAPPEDPPGGADAEPEPESGATDADTAVTTRAAPLMIYEAGLSLAVNDIRSKIDEVAETSIEIGGYIVRQDDASIVVRVPAGRFRDALQLFEAMGDVLDRRISAQDVSEAVRDLRIRLQNAEQMRDRLIALLAEATTVQDSLVTAEAPPPAPPDPLCT